MVGTAAVLARRRCAVPGRHLPRGVGAVSDADPAVPPRAQRGHHAHADPPGRRRPPALAVRERSSLRGDACRAARAAGARASPVGVVSRVRGAREAAPGASGGHGAHGADGAIPHRSASVREDPRARGRRAVRERVRSATGIRRRSAIARRPVREAGRDRGAQRRARRETVLLAPGGVARHPASRAEDRRRVRQLRASTVSSTSAGARSPTGGRTASPGRALGSGAHPHGQAREARPARRAAVLPRIAAGSIGCWMRSETSAGPSSSTPTCGETSGSAHAGSRFVKAGSAAAAPT